MLNLEIEYQNLFVGVSINEYREEILHSFLSSVVSKFRSLVIVLDFFT